MLFSFQYCRSLLVGDRWGATVHTYHIKQHHYSTFSALRSLLKHSLLNGWEVTILMLTIVKPNSCKHPIINILSQSLVIYPDGYESLTKPSYADAQRLHAWQTTVGFCILRWPKLCRWWGRYLSWSVAVWRASKGNVGWEWCVLWSGSGWTTRQLSFENIIVIGRL